VTIPSGVVRLRCLVLGSLVAGLSACGSFKGSEVHLIPEGYRGPVVILYESSAVESELPRERDSTIYKIGNDGVVSVATQARSPGFYDVKYFYVAPDGTRSELPYETDTEKLQVFGAVDGMTRAGDDSPSRSVRWAAYIVAVPSERDDWVQLREHAVERAVRGLWGEAIDNP